MLCWRGCARQRLRARTPQVKYAKLRGTPGSPPDKLAEAEREVADAEQRVRDARIRCAGAASNCACRPHAGRLSWPGTCTLPTDRARVQRASRRRVHTVYAILTECLQAAKVGRLHVRPPHMRRPPHSYEELVSRLTEELNRFQKERAADTNALLRDLALTQVWRAYGLAWPRCMRRPDPCGK